METGELRETESEMLLVLVINVMLGYTYLLTEAEIIFYLGILGWYSSYIARLAVFIFHSSELVS